jgi:hypothetical protein
MFQHFMFSLLVGSWREYKRAFAETFLIVLVMVGFAGMALFRNQLNPTQKPLDIVATECQVDSCGSRATMLIRTTPPHARGANGSFHQLVECAIGQSQPVFEPIELDLHPVCFVASHGHREFFVAARDDGSIWQISRPGSSSCRRFGRHVHGPAHTMLLGTDERTLVTLGPNEIYAWDIPTAKLRWCRLQESPVAGVVLSASQSMICCSNNRQSTHLRELDLETGETLQSLDSNTCWIKRLVASPNGHFVAGVDNRSGIFLFERRPGGEKWHQHRPYQHFAGTKDIVPAFSPDSRLLAYGKRDTGEVLIWDLRDKVEVGRLGPIPDTLKGLLFLNRDQLLGWNRDGSTETWAIDRCSSVHLESLAGVN